MLDIKFIQKLPYFLLTSFSFNRNNCDYISDYSTTVSCTNIHLNLSSLIHYFIIQYGGANNKTNQYNATRILIKTVTF